MLKFLADEPSPTQTVGSLPLGTLFTIRSNWPLYLKTDAGCIRVGRSPHNHYRTHGHRCLGEKACSPAVDETREVEDTYGLLWITDDGRG